MTTAQKAGAAAVALIVLAGTALLFARDRVETVVRTVDRRLLTPSSTPEEAPSEPPMEAAEVEEDRPKSPPGPSLTISGFVLSPTGEPMQDARVWAYLPNGFQHGSVRIKRDGTFKFPGFEPNSTVQLEVEARHIPPVPKDPEGGQVHLGESNVENLRIQLMEPLWLRGTVVNSAGDPQPGIDVIAQRKPVSYDGGSLAASDLKGNIAIGVGYGEYEIYFLHANHWIALKPEPQRIVVTKDTDLNGVIILCPDEIEPRRVVTGIVTDSAGKPVSNAEIQSEADQFRGARAQSNSRTDGTYAIVVDNQTKRLFATHPYYSNSPSATIDATTTTVNFTMPPVAKVQGRVIDARTGQPIPEFRVYAGIGSNRDDDYSIVRNENGEFISTNVKAGSIAVWVAARGYADGFTNIGPVAPGEVRTSVEVRLTRGVELEGRVLDSSGKPLRLARITYMPAGGRQLLIERFGSDISNDDGYFLLQSIPVGPVTLQAVHENFIPKIIHLNVVPGQPEVRIVFDVVRELKD